MKILAAKTTDTRSHHFRATSGKGTLGGAAIQRSFSRGGEWLGRSLALPGTGMAQVSKPEGWGNVSGGGGLGNPRSACSCPKTTAMGVRTACAVLLMLATLARAGEQQWILKASMPTARSSPASGVIDGRIYLAGGGTDSGLEALPSLEVYDPGADSWEIKAPMPTARWGLTSGIIDGQYYIIAGGSPIPNGTVNTEEFHPTSNQWITKSDMPNPGWGVASGVINNTFYVVGGYNWPSWGMNWNREYDPATDQWRLKSHMPTQRSWLSAEVIDNKLYAVGGWNWNDTIDLPTLEVYDPISDSWTTKASLPVGLKNPATAALGGKLYVMGGSTGEGASARWYASVYVYDPAADVWTRLADLPQAIAGAAAETFNGRTLSITGLTQLRHLAPMISPTRSWAARRVPPLSLSGRGLGQGRLSCQ